ncbi:MAG: TonB-dependent receptor [Ignavibacteriaceae bacterium]
MANRKIAFLLAFSALMLLVNISNASAQSSGRITGTVKEGASGEVLWGANVMILGTSLGGSTNSNGKFTIQNIPFGSYTLRVTYIGFKQQEISIDIKSNRTTEVNFEMEPEAVKGETVTVTAQRKGQISAINQQLNSNTITNVVSSDKIQELPEANAAEAVGRLPGVSLLRKGGEGSKVVIRGLAPQYNKVQIDGVDLAATDPRDRSTDLSMISPYMLDGIEVTKAAMANQEADQLGGTVNFITKGAPYTNPSYSIIAEGGYNGLRSEYGDYKFVGQTSRRMFKDLFGVSLNLDVEKRNRSSNTANADYYFKQEYNRAVVNSFNVEDISRELKRYGGSLVLDYKTPSTTIITSNFLSKIDHDDISRSENSVNLVTAQTERDQQLNHIKTNTTVLMDQIRWEQIFNNFKIQTGISYSLSKDVTPRELTLMGVEGAPLSRPIDVNASPGQIPSYMSNDTTQMYLGPMYDSNELTKEEQMSANLDLQWQYDFSDAINIKLNFGGKYKHKDRKYDYNTVFIDVYSDPSNSVTNALLSRYPYMRKYYTSGRFPYQPFIDNGYADQEFMKGEYKLQRVPNLTLGEDAINYLENTLGISRSGASVPQTFVPNFQSSRMNDYNGNEFYSAAYIMPIISFGNQLTFIPGVRYEHEKTKYDGVRGNENLIHYATVGYYSFDTTATRTNEFVLPMIHLRYKPFDWFDVRLSYTQTLARPDYTDFLPKWNVYLSGIDYSNPDLRPAKSENYDLYFSFYGNKIGLFTIGLFAKRITDFVFSQTEVLLSDTMAVQKYGLLQSLTGQDPVKFSGKPINSYINDPNPVTIRGIEIEWQANLWYLPGFLKNIVFDINYTYTYSKAVYPRTVPIKKVVSSPLGNIIKIVGNADSAYSAPLLFQPDNILNVTLGYDYEGFSIRTSLQYQSQIFSQNDWRSELRGFTKGFSLFDLTVSQKLPVSGLKIYGSLNNISQVIQEDDNVGTGYMTNKEYYGMSGSLGIKYEF